MFLARFVNFKPFDKKKSFCYDFPVIKVTILNWSGSSAG